MSNKNIPKKNYHSFVEYKKLELKIVPCGELKLILLVNDIRVFRLEFYLNEIFIKHETLTGKNFAEKRWDELLNSFNF